MACAHLPGDTDCTSWWQLRRRVPVRRVGGTRCSLTRAACCGNTAWGSPRRAACSGLLPVKGSQFKQPLRVLAACADAAKRLRQLTQLFGDCVYWANATGCSAGVGRSFPGILYHNKRASVRHDQQFFENNAELSLGLYLPDSAARGREVARREARAGARMRFREPGRGQGDSPTLSSWGRSRIRVVLPFAAFDDFDASRAASDTLVAAIEDLRTCLPTAPRSAGREWFSFKDQLAKKTFWMFGGDGWAYDIGFGGLDTWLASGANANVLRSTPTHFQHRRPEFEGSPAGAVARLRRAARRRQEAIWAQSL